MYWLHNLSKKFDEMWLPYKVSSIMKSMKGRTHEIHMELHTMIIGYDTIISRWPYMDMLCLVVEMWKCLWRKSECPEWFSFQSCIIVYWRYKMKSIYMTWKEIFCKIFDEKCRPQWVSDEDKLRGFVLIIFAYNTIESTLFYFWKGRNISKIFLEPYFPFMIFRIHNIGHIRTDNIKMIRESIREPLFPTREFRHDIPITVFHPIKCFFVIIIAIASVDEDDLMLIHIANPLEYYYFKKKLYKSKWDNNYDHEEKDEYFPFCESFVENECSIETIMIVRTRNIYWWLRYVSYFL